MELIDSMDLLIALKYLKYVVSSSRLFSRDLAILENPLHVYKYLSVYGKSFAISMVFAVYITFLSLSDVFCSINNYANLQRSYPSTHPSP